MRPGILPRRPEGRSGASVVAGRNAAISIGVPNAKAYSPITDIASRQLLSCSYVRSNIGKQNSKQARALAML